MAVTRNTPAVRVCVVGSANVDLTFRAPRLPGRGETLTGHSFQLGFGGKGANQAVAAARLGAAVCLVARLGKDTFGQEALRQYHTEGIDTTHVRFDGDHPTGAAAIVVDDQAENAILVVPGANGALSPQDVRDARSVIQDADVLLCQLEIPLETTLEAFRLARAAEVPTVLTPAPVVPLPEELYRLTGLLIPNEPEAQLLTSLQVGSLAEIEAAARVLMGRGAGEVVLTRGKQGALLLSSEGVVPIPAVPVVAVDPTGAGDAFTAGLAVFRAEGYDCAAAARKAACVAALAVTRAGALSAFPLRTEVEGFLATRQG